MSGMESNDREPRPHQRQRLRSNGMATTGWGFAGRCFPGGDNGRKEAWVGQLSGLWSESCSTGLPDACVAYGDESGSGSDRYRCVSVVSGRRGSLQDLRQHLQGVLERCGVSRVEWKDVGGDSRYSAAAVGYLRNAVTDAARGVIRVDVLVWDLHDSRHQVAGRDDAANLARMYHKVLVHMSRCWGQSAWEVYPDVNAALAWDELRVFLNRTSLAKRMPASQCLFPEERGPKIHIRDLRPVESDTEPLIQVADLFAGLARFSREKGGKWREWRRSKRQDDSRTEQVFLFGEEFGTLEFEGDLSRAECARFALLCEFVSSCTRKKLGVSVNKKDYLWTPRPSNPVNFWPYEPQHPQDKAPTRRRYGRR